MPVNTDQHTLKVQCPHCHTRLDLSELPAFSEINCPKCATSMVVPRWFQNILLEEVLSCRPGLQAFRALDPTLDREACVKLMHSDPAESPFPVEGSPYHKEQLDEFLEIYRRMSLLVHPNIVPVCSCSAIEGVVYGVTRFISGTPLNRPVEAGKRPSWPQVLGHSKAAVDALHYAAQKGLCHGHLTPENLLIDQDGMLFVTDFMLAVKAGKNISEEIWTAPEVAAGQAPGCHSDLFSLGVCLYQFATGEQPCSGRMKEWKAGSLQPIPPEQLLSALPEKFSTLLLRMLSISPDGRPSGYDWIKDELNQLGKGPGRVWQRKEAHARKLLLAKKPGHRPVELIGARKHKKGSLLNSIITCLLVAALALAGILFLRKKPVQDKLSEIGLLKNGKLNLQVVPDRNIPVVQAVQPEEEPAAKTENNDTRPGLLLPPEIIAARPRPADYDFKAVREQISAYLTTVPPHILEIEKERIRYLGSYKTYLLSKISKMAYLPTNSRGILLKNGRQVFGTVTMFSNEKALKVRPNRRNSSSLQEIPWEELPPRQLLDMAYSYVQRNAEEIKGTKTISRKKLEEVFDEFLYLVLLADWYQESDALKKFCQEAEALPMDGVKEKLCQYIQWPD